MDQRQDYRQLKVYAIHCHSSQISIFPVCVPNGSKHTGIVGNASITSESASDTFQMIIGTCATFRL